MRTEPHFFVSDYREPAKSPKRSRRLVTKADAFQRGRNDCKRGVSRSEVPYSRRMAQEEWERGFDWELRLSGGRSAGLL